MSRRSGIVWITDRQANEIHAYDANTLSTEVWNSNMALGGQDAVGAVTKFAPPTVVNGMVYVFDRETGRLRWNGEVTQQMLVLESWDEMPVLTMAADTHRPESYQ